ncbi:hypothetical protein [Pseudomonas nitroreducens]|uniref:hypothetical protein n=1 Tax=Pseudomonas nitroreducens TaxID=46680 RepID=UPI00351CD91A
MSDNSQMLLMLKGIVSDMTEEQRQEVYAARDDIKAIAERGEFALIGLSIAAAEIAIEQE